MTYFSAFVGSCAPVARVLSAKYQLPQWVQSSRCFAHPGGTDSHSSSHRRTHSDSCPKKHRPSIALEKRSKQYFFKLLSAARMRDKRLLVSAMKSLGEDEEYLHQMRQADPEFADPVHVQDVLLKAASRCGEPMLADRLFVAMLARGQRPTQRTAGAFLDALKRNGQADRCVSVFAEMMERGVDLGEVCFNIVVSALVQDGNFAGGMDMVERASAQWGITPDTYTFNTFLNEAAKQNSCESRAAATKARQLMAQFGVAPDRITINARIDDAIKQQRLDEAIETFERALDGGFPGVVPDVITFNVGISAYMAQGLEHRAFELLEDMKRRGVRPRTDTFNSILTGLTKRGKTSGVIEVFNKYLRRRGIGLEDNAAPTLVTYNLVFQALSLENDKAQARLVHKEMRQRGIKPDNITLAALVRLQYSPEDVYDIMETAKKLRIRPSLTFLNSCIRALGDHGDVRGACQVMDRIQALENIEPDAISYNSLIYALVQEPWVSEVIQDTAVVLGTRRTPEVVISPTVSRASGLVATESFPLASSSALTLSSRITGRFEGVIGAEAAFLLLQEMKTLSVVSGVSPDVFTYTTVISGIARAEARKTGSQASQWWRNPGSQAGSARAFDADDGEGDASSTALCNHLFLEAVEKGIPINGKLCNAVMVGFGADLTGAISFWRRHIQPALVRMSNAKSEGGAVDDICKEQARRVLEKRKEDLISAYSGLLYVCGRAQRPDAAVKVVFALRKEGVTPSATLSSTYFKAKKESKTLGEDALARPASFRVLRLLDRQLENTLTIECGGGRSKHADSLDLPIERIRIKF